MSENKYFEQFGQPFPVSDVSWRLQFVSKEKLQGIAVPYLDARAVADRLDAVVGQNNWKDEYTPWHNCNVEGKQKSSQLCTLYIYDDDKKEWIGKTDGAEDTDIEPVKGGISDAFKRAAVRWNIGRYLYDFNSEWVTVFQKKSGYDITDDEKRRLNGVYEATVKRLFGKEAPKETSPVITSPNPSKKEEPKPQQEKTEQQQSVKQPIYEIHSVKVEGEGDKKRSTIYLMRDGQRNTVFMNGIDERRRAGVKITNLKGQVKEGDFGKYTIISSYNIAA